MYKYAIMNIHPVNINLFLEKIKSGQKSNFVNRTFQENLSYYTFMLKISFDISGLNGYEAIKLREFCPNTTIRRISADKADISNLPDDVSMSFDRVNSVITRAHSASDIANKYDMFLPLRNLEISARCVFEGNQVLKIIGMSPLNDLVHYSLDGEISAKTLLDENLEINPHKEEMEKFIAMQFNKYFQMFIEESLTQSDVFTDAVLYNDFYTSIANESIEGLNSFKSMLTMVNTQCNSLNFLGGTESHILKGLEELNGYIADETGCSEKEFRNIGNFQSDWKFVFMIKSPMYVFLLFYYFSHLVVNHASFDLCLGINSNPIFEYGNKSLFDVEISNIQKSMVENIKTLSSRLGAYTKLSAEERLIQEKPKFNKKDIYELMTGLSPIYFMVSGTSKELFDFIHEIDSLSYLVHIPEIPDSDSSLCARGLNFDDIKNTCIQVFSLLKH